jgi:hypothetical protein
MPSEPRRPISTNFATRPDTLTRQLRLCCLMRPAARPEAKDTGKDAKVLQGHTFQPPFMDGMQTALKPIRFVEAAAREYA